MPEIELSTGPDIPPLTIDTEKDEISMNPEQEAKVIAEWNSRAENPPSIDELTLLVFNRECDGRSKEARCIKKFLATKNLKVKAPSTYKPKQRPVLTEEQKVFIANNASVCSALDMARTLFNNSRLTNLNIECIVVNEYLKELDPNVSNTVAAQNAEIPGEEYEPPATFDQSLKRINNFIDEKIDKNKMTVMQKKAVLRLMGYLHIFRFIHQIKSFATKTDQELFESSFIRYAHDKPDLTQEEIDQYITLSTEIVIASNLLRRIAGLHELMDVATEEARSSGVQKFNMGLVEGVNKLQSEYNQCVNRQQKLLDDLKEKRSSRISKEVRDNSSVLNLVNTWKDEEQRKRMIRYTEMQKKAVTEEVANMMNMDELRSRILGLTKDEAENG